MSQAQPATRQAKLDSGQAARFAYFSMEIGLENGMPTYSGGLGILAGDMVHAAADLKVPMVAISLLYRKGHFKQLLDDQGVQTDAISNWEVEKFLTQLPNQVQVKIEGRKVLLRIWKYEVTGISGHVIPIFFLDADLPENEASDRVLTDVLYGGESHYRICQETLLGFGGIRALRTLGVHRIERYHLNEGHAAFLTLELISEQMKKEGRTDLSGRILDEVKAQAVFTTHTPVPAGHDWFDLDMVRQVIGDHPVFSQAQLWERDGQFNMTQLAFRLSHYANGVSKKHSEVIQKMFPEVRIRSITNGVQAGRWVSDPVAALFDQAIPNWRTDNRRLVAAAQIPPEKVSKAHQLAKQVLIDWISENAQVTLDPKCFTIGFARRATGYKRADLLFHDMDRLRQIVDQRGGEFKWFVLGKPTPKMKRARGSSNGFMKPKRFWPGKFRSSISPITTWRLASCWWPALMSGSIPPSRHWKLLAPAG